MPLKAQWPMRFPSGSQQRGLRRNGRTMPASPASRFTRSQDVGAGTRSKGKIHRRRVRCQRHGLQPSFLWIVKKRAQVLERICLILGFSQNYPQACPNSEASLSAISRQPADGARIQGFSGNRLWINGKFPHRVNFLPKPPTAHPRVFPKFSRRGNVQMPWTARSYPQIWRKHCLHGFLFTWFGCQPLSHFAKKP